MLSFISVSMSSHVHPCVNSVLIWNTVSVIEALSCTSTSTQKTNVLEYMYDYFRKYSSTITLECNHDYFNE